MFLLRPQPFFDESLSSWRQRAGFANGFWRFPSPARSSSYIDPDRLPNQGEQQWLSDQCGIALQTVADLSLEAGLAQFQSGVVFSPHPRWILMLGQHSESGPMFCPECLRTDDRPYFRAHWRYAFLTECPEHQLPLLDRCPHCNQFVWPATIKSLEKRNPWFCLTECPHCNFDLKTAQVKDNKNASVSYQLWKMLINNEVAQEFQSIQNLSDFFDGLWVLSQLLVRRTGQSVMHRIPFATYDELNLPIGRAKLIEGLAIVQRAKIISGAYWLMEKWPDRFLSIAKETGITKSSFIPTSSVNPSWLMATLNANLARRNKHITTGDVSRAIWSLRKEGKTVSKMAVRNLLEVSESKVINSMLHRRNHARPEELMAIVRKFEHSTVVISTSRDQKAALLRDYLIFILSILSRCSVDDICKLSETDVRKLIFQSPITSTRDREIESSLRVRANTLNAEYANYVRPKFLKFDSPSDRWFIGREGKEFAGHTLRERIAKWMRKELGGDLWNSCDAFIYTLGEPPFGRRLLRQKSTLIDSVAEPIGTKTCRHD